MQHYILPCQHIREYPRATRHAQEDTLYLDIKQYRPLDNLAADDGSVTIIGAGRTGFPKVSDFPWIDACRLRLLVCTQMRVSVGNV